MRLISVKGNPYCCKVPSFLYYYYFSFPCPSFSQRFNELQSAWSWINPPTPSRDSEEKRVNKDPLESSLKILQRLSLRRDSPKTPSSLSPIIADFPGRRCCIFNSFRWSFLFGLRNEGRRRIFFLHGFLRLKISQRGERNPSSPFHWILN